MSLNDNQREKSQVEVKMKVYKIIQVNRCNGYFFINRIVLKTRAQIREHFNIFNVENFRSFGENYLLY